MANIRCERCRFRALYDKNPKSVIGRLWRWHAGWCPGWRLYMKSLSPEDRKGVAEKYALKKYL